jgi:peroxiredoxin
LSFPDARSKPEKRVESPKVVTCCLEGDVGMAVKERTKERTDAPGVAAEVEEMSADDIDASFVPRIRPEVTGVEIEGEAVLVIEGDWSVYWLNQISAIVFNEFDGVSSVDEVAARLSQAFGADPEVVRNDVMEMTRKLGGGGFLEGIAADEVQQSDAAFEGLPLGTAMPPFELADLKGRSVSAEDLLGQRTFLVNWSPHCGYCAQIAPEIAKLQPKLRARGVQTVFISTGAPKDIRKQVKEFNLDVPVFLQESREAEIFSGMGTPAAYLIDAEGKTASRLVSGSDAVPVLLRKAAGISRKANGSKRASGSKKAAGSKRRVASKK